MKKRRPIFEAPKATLRERWTIVGGLTVAVASGIVVGLVLSDMLYQ